MAIVSAGYIKAWSAEELVSAQFTPTRILEHRVHATEAGPAVVARRAVVELLRDVGGHPQWALLGGSVEPADDEAVSVGVNVSGDDAFTTDLTVHSPLGTKLLLGLPNDYAEVVAEVMLAQDAGPRRICIDRAGHHYVDSSPVAFRGAARLLSYVLQHGRLPESAELRAVVIGEL